MRFFWQYALKGFFAAVVLQGGALGAQSLEIKDSQELESARMIGNSYGWITVVNSAGGPGSFSCSERLFQQMPQVTVIGERTLEEGESRIRLFLDPQVRFLGGGNHRTQAVWRWAMKDRAEVLELTPVNASELPAQVKISIEPAEEHSFFSISAEFQNPGDRECTAECQFPFYAQMPGVNPPGVVIPHELIRFQAVNGKVEKKTVMLRDPVILNGDENTYWWRKQIDPDLLWQLGNTICEEKIPFAPPKMKAPEYVAVSGSVGNSILIFHKMQEMTRLELMWQAAIVRVMPVFRVRIPARSSKTIAFRLLLGKGLTRVDNVAERFVSAYAVRGNSVQVSLMPLEVIRQITVDVSLYGGGGNVVGTRSYEVKGMSPFEPWRESLELNQALVANGQYPVKLRVNDTLTANRLYELENVVIP